ncbi:STAS domain-containing protein [Aminivibrio sp.]|jgi:anti-sigma B factor antagonist|uniref:STAS domain-containing protein n=1 Tax=Aminivibrio sp. TaxID=1872489 RepID=UPI001A383FAB|nr:STAS domain-containing protein [Aminivibrio sp.]MBL3539977.1 STAS domain-containing protein [Aminivibrio sp.]MDK2959018.1 anti-sigma factor antagonist [Synergistaceae bacterium]
MKVDISKSGSGARIRLGGSMYVEDSASVREQLIGLLEEGIINLTIDLSGLDYVDSSGLGVLISIHKRCLQKGGKMVITGLRGMVEELFRLTRLDLVFNVSQQ